MFFEAFLLITYLRAHGTLPPQYITKSAARQHGWRGGSVERLLPNCSIGGDLYYNRNGALPHGSYHECDIGDTSHDRGECRLVYSDDARYFVTTDHYDTFTEIW